jgi:hypothetical protein
VAVAGGEPAQALFPEARRRRRRRWQAGIAAVLLASAVVGAAMARLHLPAGRVGGATRHAVTVAVGLGPAARSSAAAAVWFDGIRLHLGYLDLAGRMTQHAGPEANADLLPLVPAGERVYWVDPAGTFVPALGHWSQVVMYLDLATGTTGNAGPGQTVFLSADRRFLLRSLTATTLARTPVAGNGPLRQYTLPSGWYLPGGDGLPNVVSGAGLATANGIVVQSRESPNPDHPANLALWSPGSGRVRILGRGLAVIGAYTPPRGRHSLLAWLPATCRFPDNCLLRITNTATLAARTVRGPSPEGFAMGGAFSPDGTRLAVFTQDFSGPTSMSARLAIVDLTTGSIRLAASPRFPLGLDFATALWLPDSEHLVAGTGDWAFYLVDAATLTARPLSFPRGHGGGSRPDFNFTAAVVPPRR